VVAFANSNGGKLLVGVDDNGEIPGVKFPEEEEYILNKAIAELCSPRIDYELEVIRLSEFEERAVLLYDIPAGSKKPYYAREKPKDKYGKAYIRLADKSIQASREVVGILKRKKRDQDSAFRFGEKEKLLLSYLETHGRVTVREFSELAKISPYQSSQKLILLASNHVIRIHPNEKEDYFVFAEESSY
ncbi:MAG: ATP-binding protein, partial [Bacteroidota bacterium]